MECIAVKLGKPCLDPHGDPIPARDLTMLEPATRSLAECPVNSIGRFVRVSDADPAMLRYLGEREIRPGQRFRIVDRQPSGGLTSATFDDESSIHPLGGELARAMRVTVTPA